MLTRSWIRRLFAPRRPRPVRKAAARCRLFLETLEARSVPTVSFGTPAAFNVGAANATSVPDPSCSPGKKLALVSARSRLER
jgi:hypothetical protein